MCFFRMLVRPQGRLLSRRCSSRSSGALRWSQTWPDRSSAGSDPGPGPPPHAAPGCRQLRPRRQHRSPRPAGQSPGQAPSLWPHDCSRTGPATGSAQWPGLRSTNWPARGPSAACKQCAVTRPIPAAPARTARPGLAARGLPAEGTPLASAAGLVVPGAVLVSRGSPRPWPGTAPAARHRATGASNRCARTLPGSQPRSS
jgi:hypothetical protein